MNIVKEELKRRNWLIFYARNFSHNNLEQFTSNLKKTVDAVIRKGILLIDEIDTMYWTDTDFVLDLTNYLRDSHIVISHLKNQTDIDHISDFFSEMHYQTQLFFNYIEEHISHVNDFKMIKICACDFPSRREHFN